MSDPFKKGDKVEIEITQGTWVPGKVFEVDAYQKSARVYSDVGTVNMAYSDIRLAKKTSAELLAEKERAEEKEELRRGLLLVALLCGCAICWILLGRVYGLSVLGAGCLVGAMLTKK